MPNGVKFFPSEGISLLERQPRHFSTAVGKLARTIPKLDNRCLKCGEIAASGFPQEGNPLPQEVFGSNLVLDCKEARDSCVKPWSRLVEKNRRVVEWCAREDLNLQPFRDQILSLARLPFRHARAVINLRRAPANLKPGFGRRFRARSARLQPAIAGAERFV